ncbi:MAG: HAD family hydrolase [Chthoniobacterales bacterium]|nr:MAG: HAD family hydrolase [Chthoniobacterales bacterium]
MGEHEIKRRAVFLDRDGVLNRPVVKDGLPFPPATLAEFELYPDVPESCARLKEAGFLLIVVTNQPDVGRGTQSRESVEAIHAQLRVSIPLLDGIEVCFHAGSAHGEPCDCRKPKPGMLLHAAAAHEIDLKQSFVIGDRWRDIDCAHAAGCRAVFIDHGYRETLRERPEFTVANFQEAVAAILRAIARNHL